MAEYQNDGNLLRKIYFAMLPVNILGAEKPVKKKRWNENCQPNTL
jgi:hypothetical protein